jgi:putative tricarboxylic transport membrane protein
VRVPDVVFGLCFSVGGLALGAASLQMPGMGGQWVGPGLLPTIVAAGFAVFGLALIASGAREVRHLQVPAFGAVRDQVRSMPPLVPVVLGGLCVYIAVVDVLGFIVTTVLFVTAVVWAGSRAPWRSLAFAVVVTLAISVLFTRLLRVPLPPGVLG